MNVVYEDFSDKWGCSGFVNLQEFLADFKIIHISKKSPIEERSNIFLHEYAHLIQLEKKKTLLELLNKNSQFFEMVNFHDKQFWKIFYNLGGDK